ncbi:hypothetical protein ACRAWF_21345 [Streptomyces sp. L7]
MHAGKPSLNTPGIPQSTCRERSASMGPATAWSCKRAVLSPGAPLAAWRLGQRCPSPRHRRPWSSAHPGDVIAADDDGAWWSLPLRRRGPVETAEKSAASARRRRRPPGLPRSWEGPTPARTCY